MTASRATSAEGVRLATVARKLGEASILIDGAAAGEITVTGVSDDSRITRQGDLFCAWVGTTTDGHAYVPDAERAGAAAALVEHHVPAVDLPQLIVADGRRAAAIGASVVLGDPGSALRLAAVTGTNGKTTTVWILRHLLSERYSAASIGTLGAILNDGSVLSGTGNLTTPGPVELAHTLRRLVEQGIEAVAMEVSSHALQQGRVQALRFDAAVFTNLSREHLDYHGTMESYLAAKLLLLDLLRDEGWAVVNADEPVWGAITNESHRVLSFGMVPDADVRAANVSLSASGAEFRLEHGDDAADVALPLPGGFNVSNALGAAAAALGLGFPLDHVARALGTVPQVPGRLERIAQRPCQVLRDYAHTPDALETVLLALRPLAAGRLIVVFGAGGDRDRGKRPVMGAVAQRNADVVIVTSDNPRTEDPDRIIDDIVAGMEPSQVTREVDRRTAIAMALDAAKPDDVVLLAGKGHETYQILGTTRRRFDEKEIVAELLTRYGVGGARGDN